MKPPRWYHVRELDIRHYSLGEAQNYCIRVEGSDRMAYWLLQFHYKRL